jgi:uncharacterized membrane protein YhhN
MAQTTNMVGGAMFFAVLYLVVGHWYFKAIPIWLLAIAATFKYPSPHSQAIAIGLLLSSVGDIFLEWVDTYTMEDFFIPGLLAFLCAHLAYIYGMYLPMEKKSMVSIPFLVLYYGVVMYKLIPKAENELKLPVMVYGLAICTMAFMAINRFCSAAVDGKSSFFGMIGSFLFMVSDTILAFDKFYAPMEGAKFLLMVCYYAAQLFITASVLSVPSLARVSRARKSS